MNQTNLCIFRPAQTYSYLQTSPDLHISLDRPRPTHISRRGCLCCQIRSSGLSSFPTKTNRSVRLGPKSLLAKSLSRQHSFYKAPFWSVYRRPKPDDAKSFESMPQFYLDFLLELNGPQVITCFCSVFNEPTDRRHTGL